MAENGPFIVHVNAHVREEHEWVSRAGGLFRFLILEVRINGNASSGTRLALLVTDLDEGEYE